MQTLPLTTALTLKATRASYGIYRGRERIATISTAIMDQEEIGRALAAMPRLLAFAKQVADMGCHERAVDHLKSEALDIIAAAEPA